MKRLLALAACVLALAPVAARGAEWGEEATLLSADRTIACAGERYWSTRTQRTFWTEGRRCALTYDQCLAGHVMDRDHTHKVKSCSPDSKASRGRKANY